MRLSTLVFHVAPHPLEKWTGLNGYAVLGPVQVGTGDGP